ncbi:hypothetical protein V6C53_16600 [Desulfocurvibacter africanus]|uniref:hypothetical protein n=1 Tax=Desulfocurvibacter africanus TaxID=873 RepID=UPI0011830BC9|nr:hypothetical protein [Desulfocurvibacter africanus]
MQTALNTSQTNYAALVDGSPGRAKLFLEQIAFKTPAPALTAQVNCAYAYAAASYADAWLAAHFQKQNA